MYYQDIIGQNLIKKQLKKMLFEKTYPQSQLFIDSNGYGGLPLAINTGLSLIYGLNKMEEHEQKKIPFSNLIDHPDLHFVYPTINKPKTKSEDSEGLDLASLWKKFLISSPYGEIYDWLKILDSGNKQGIIGVEEVSKIHQKMSLKAHSGGNKVLIIWGAEKLNIQASNKLLKIIEEPPQKTFFLIVAEKPFTLLPTLISRCQRIKLPPIEKNEINIALNKFNLDTDIIQVVKFSKGSWRKILKTVFEKEEKGKFENYLAEFLRICFQIKKSKRAIIDLFNWSDSISSINREGQKNFIKYVLEAVRQSMLITYQANQLVDFQYFTHLDFSKMAPHVHSKNVQEITTLLEETIYFLERNANSKIIFSHFAIALARELNVKEEVS